MAVLLAMLLIHAAPQSPYHWHLSCSRWLEKSEEISRDVSLTPGAKRALIGYLRGKVDGSCDFA